MNTPPINMHLLGSLLKCPQGDNAIAVGNFAFDSNKSMIFNTIDTLSLQPQSSVLEIGFGNGKHLSYLFDKHPSISYMGIETSEIMITEAQTYIQEHLSKATAKFLKVSPDLNNNIPTLFDNCFSVNTLYFLDQPINCYQKIYKLLNPSAKITIGFIDKTIGEKAPFITQDFQFYTVEEVENILLKSGFISPEKKYFEELLISQKGKKIKRCYWVITAYTKP